MNFAILAVEIKYFGITPFLILLRSSHSHSVKIMSRDILQYMRPENLAKEETEISPSGKHRLVIRYYKTKEGCWEYTQGRLFRVADDEFITTVERNYCHFHHNFVQQGDKEYLITGRSYMGLTIVDCASGQEWNYQPTQEDWCQANWKLSPDGKTLLVSACVWGGPYDFLYYDFDLTKFDPSKGLPQLSLDENLVRPPPEPFIIEGLGDVNPPQEGIYLNDRGEMIFQQGKDIPQDLRGNFTPNDETWYLVFTYPVKYNHRFKMDQEDLYWQPKLWFEVIPEDLHPQLQGFLEKWPDSQSHLKDWKGYWEDREKIRSQCKPHLKKDCTKINRQVAILERVDDKVIYRHYYELRD